MCMYVHVCSRSSDVVNIFLIRLSTKFLPISRIPTCLCDYIPIVNINNSNDKKKFVS